MVTYQQLRDATPATYERYATAWRTVGAAMSEAKDRVEAQVAAGMRKADLKGAGAEAAQRRLRTLAENHHFTQLQCALIHAALSGLATDLTAAQRRLAAAGEDARAAGFTVQDDGSVHWEVAAPHADRGADGSTPYSPLADGRAAEAQLYADRITAALQEAADADQGWRARLDALTADNDLDVTDEDWVDAGEDTEAVGEATGSADDIPAGGSPAANAAWWASLTPDERARHLALHPERIGALDGLPAEARDEANRAHLATEAATVQMKLDELRANEPEKYRVLNGMGGEQRTTSPEWNAWRAQVTRYENTRGGIAAIEKRFAQTGERGLPEAYLLGFSAEADGRVILANGNPDTAHHTAVYVPGTTTDLPGIGGDLRRMDELWRASAVRTGDPVSTITWFGYDAPDDIVKDSPFSHYADDGAGSYSSFLHGLDAAHDQQTPSHTTAIGHSYGTTLIGSTARQFDLPVDDVILAGSPGVQVGNASDLGVPHGHVWNQEARGDHVPDIGQFGHGAYEPPHMEVGPSRVPVFDPGGFIVPSDPEFGANQLTTDTEGHSDYWKRGTQSLDNQAAVVAGKYHLAQTQ
ncbi:alpha/beta hydrolase [Streptomyces polyrhachis]|uniref:Alpha/beta hydrolase n=1 Tax=Streptomyces polyrhachis TaxID=1282885 RepID=A0ABW2GFI6_9ACTN